MPDPLDDLAGLFHTTDGDTDGDSDVALIRNHILYDLPNSAAARTSATTVRLGVVGGRGHALWGHHLWNGARVMVEYLFSRPELVKGKNVLELGAGAGLPGLLCAKYLEASQVVLTDYPDFELIENLRLNVLENDENGSGQAQDRLWTRCHARGYLWGKEIQPLLECLPTHNNSPNLGVGDAPQFDLLLLADLLFNHSCHVALVDTILSALADKPHARALVFFTPYRPWLLGKDLAFFDVCRSKGLDVVKLFERKMDKVMFEKDRGDEELRKTVFAWEVSRGGDWTLSASKSDG